MGRQIIHRKAGWVRGMESWQARLTLMHLDLVNGDEITGPFSFWCMFLYFSKLNCSISVKTEPYKDKRNSQKENTAYKILRWKLFQPAASITYCPCVHMGETKVYLTWNNLLLYQPAVDYSFFFHQSKQYSKLAVFILLCCRILGSRMELNFILGHEEI